MSLNPVVVSELDGTRQAFKGGMDELRGQDFDGPVALRLDFPDCESTHPTPVDPPPYGRLRRHSQALAGRGHERFNRGPTAANKRLRVRDKKEARRLEI